jgi:FAD/FMN-containing dehydrogenase
LLIGSQGTLGVITQVTLKVKPLTPRSAVLLKPVADFADAEHAIETVLHGPQFPAGLELFSTLPESIRQVSFAKESTPQWLAVILQGSDSEVNSQLSALCIDLAKAGTAPTVLAKDQGETVVQYLHEFPALIQKSTEGLALKLHFQPSRLLAGLRWLTSMQPGIEWQAHAGTGIVYALLPKQLAASLSQWLLHTAHPEVAKLGGRLQLWRVPDTTDLTTTALWGPQGDAGELNRAIREQFDPQGLLNAGRFWS